MYLVGAVITLGWLLKNHFITNKDEPYEKDELPWLIGAIVLWPVAWFVSGWLWLDWWLRSRNSD